MAQIETLALAHFYNEGSRGRRGGAPSNDKVWGIARIQGTLVNFWGRRGGKMKFKTHIDGLRPVAELLQTKVTKGYRELGPKMAATLCPGIEADLVSHYYSDLRQGKVNTNH